MSFFTNANILTFGAVRDDSPNQSMHILKLNKVYEYIFYGLSRETILTTVVPTSWL